MTTIRSKSEEIRAYVLRNIRKPRLGSRVAEKFGISKQAASKHIRAMVIEGTITPAGETRNRAYKLAKTQTNLFSYKITSSLAEDEAWRNDIVPAIGPNA